jgi:hypothetical protein
MLQQLPQLQKLALAPQQQSKQLRQVRRPVQTLLSVLVTSQMH